ncbi:unnamed protein product [Paramecium sonneborni]|uniref:Uncharacterized protein n=1 Tax=Paramecium sonneborni TaxID=65129 RepID=A0A8S1KWQ8_9CILI|nr:unnamed protein product [Paramecium sonneborni]
MINKFTDKYLQCNKSIKEQRYNFSNFIKIQQLLLIILLKPFLSICESKTLNPFQVSHEKLEFRLLLTQNIYYQENFCINKTETHPEQAYNFVEQNDLAYKFRIVLKQKILHKYVKLIQLYSQKQ